ncbi:hypothetical protein MAHJHV54_47830 [Mycobacterium avium subsp. hominissuis]
MLFGRPLWVQYFAQLNQVLYPQRPVVAVERLDLRDDVGVEVALPLGHEDRRRIGQSAIVLLAVFSLVFWGVSILPADPGENVAEHPLTPSRRSAAAARCSG